MTAKEAAKLQKKLQSEDITPNQSSGERLMQAARVIASSEASLGFTVEYASAICRYLIDWSQKS